MSNSKQVLDETKMEAWAELVRIGMTNSISGLSQMVGQEITITSLESRVIQIKDISEMFGGPEAQAAAIYLSISGVASGHMIIIYSPQTAFDLIDMLLDEPPGTTTELGEMEESVLGEMGNIVGSFFLNAMSDTTSVDLRISTPSVMLDMVGAVLDSITAEIMIEADEALVMETTFGTKDMQINGVFLAMPSLDLQNALLENWKV
ncbi:MAG: chemotaxis protein CheC [Chloroflexi bacterium]|nr:chemotaxis protein CheC [Chloroflexota bacterium]